MYHAFREGVPPEARIPRWLRIVLASDRAGSAWYIGTGFFFAPVLAVLSPWPSVTAMKEASSASTQVPSSE